MTRITFVWMMICLAGCERLDRSEPEPDASPDAGNEDTGVASSTEELLATADEALELADLGVALNQTLLATVGDPRFIESIPLRNGLTDFQCDRLDGVSVGHCPTYHVSCNDANEITGLTATFASSGCAECIRGGDPMSGSFSISRERLGVYSLVFDNLVKGDLTVEGAVEITAERGTDGAELTVRTVGAPLTITRESEGGSVTVTASLDPFSFVAPSAGEDRLILDWNVEFASTTGRSFSLHTADLAGNDDPLRFDGPSEGCRGPSGGSMTYERVLPDRTVLVSVTFGSEDGIDALCSRPAVTISVEPEPTAEDVRDALEALATELRTRIEERAGNVPDEDLLNRDATSESTDSLAPARAVAALIREGELANAIEDGWSSLVCDATTDFPCTSGSGSSTVACVGNVPTDVSATLGACVLNGITYDGTVAIHRELPDGGNLRGTMSFTEFSANGTNIQGDLTLMKIAEPPTLEVEIRAGDEGLSVSREDSPDCAMDIRFDAFRITQTDVTTEVEFDGEAETSSGAYALATIENDGHHALWDRPATCTCPNAGTVVDIETPALSGLIGAQVTMRVTYGAADADSCATVSVDFPEWPYSTLRKAATAAALAPVLEQTCVDG